MIGVLYLRGLSATHTQCRGLRYHTSAVAPIAQNPTDGFNMPRRATSEAALRAPEAERVPRSFVRNHLLAITVAQSRRVAIKVNYPLSIIFCPVLPLCSRSRDPNVKIVLQPPVNHRSRHNSLRKGTADWRPSVYKLRKSDTYTLSSKAFLHSRQQLYLKRTASCYPFRSLPSIRN